MTSHKRTDGTRVTFPVEEAARMEAEWSWHGWHATDSHHRDACGCLYTLMVELGADYHESWRLDVRCAEHSRGADR